MDGVGTVGWESSRANRAERECDRLAERIAKLEAALRGICNHVNEFGEMMIRDQDDYGLGERIDAAEKLLAQ